ncbi:uncharacterized protein LOC126843776 [Adelges cooleyi]|uniref:uncharacterized protein LOC126843776 n=1 Tax=Adelges cooleyi TaxID=133065 RepID=UPI00217F4DB9|nr:uncharacterized protein LOC126843776 [Adelges cooleyi]XP_050437489.1 uncharacterized protein LOC126843776 [Adelges cooleyi]XP_050437490.1 uncharacterized protein LOC126843776 [Adelges cooleyi]
MIRSGTMRFQRIMTIVCLAFLSVTSARFTGFRKHKVHNIVLYPDKHSWCTSTPIKQVVTFDNCEPAQVENRVCLGTCFSYSIPRTYPAGGGDEVSPYCDSCQPSNTSWVPIELVCNDGKNATKYVQKIDDCKCASCSKHWTFEEPTLDDVDGKDETTTFSSTFSEFMKLQNDGNNVEEEEEDGHSSTDVSFSLENSTRSVYERNIWIRGPHHSKVLLRKETVDGNQND